MEYDGTGERDFLKDIAITKTYEQNRYAQLMSAFRCAEAKCKTLEAELAKRVEPAVKLNADKMAFMREFVLLRAAKVESTHEMFSKTVHNAELTWNAMVAACEVKP